VLYVRTTGTGSGGIAARFSGSREVVIKGFKDVSPRTKILLFALLFIIVPSGILGYLGFRSIGNRGLSLKENYRSMARLMRDELQGELANIEDRFLREALDLEWTQDARASRLLLAGLRERHPDIGEAFILGAGGVLIHPEYYLEAGIARRGELARARAAQNSFIARGERYELAELDYAAAARSYKEAIRRAATPDLRSYARLLLGRCYFKMKDYAGAAEQYRVLSEQSDEARSSDGTPLRIIGLFRLAETYASLGRGDDEVHTLLALFEELSLGSGGFESWDFYLESVRADLDSIFKNRELGKSERDSWDSLKLEAEARTKKIGRLEELRQALLSRLDLYAPLNDTSGSAQGSALSSHVTVSDPDGTSRRFGYMYLPYGEDLPGRRVLAYEVDRRYVLTDLFPRLAGGGEAGENIRAALLSEAGPLTSLPEGPPPAQALAAESLSENFPGWRLALFDSRGKSIDEVVRGEMRLYAAVLLGIAVLIVAGIVMTLRAATHEAETVRLRSDFVSNVSHELKTPLSLIRLFGETLEAEQWTDDGKRREFARIIARESRRLTHLIDNILDFSKIDSGRKEYTFERGDLVEVIADTVEAYRFHLRDQGFTFDVSLPQGPVVMSLDKDAIAQALLNLLNNAEKYSGERKYIGVKMDLEADHIRIAVEDQGPGIPPSEVKRIFDRFYRAGNRAAGEAQGCGLGLTIVKNTVEGHGGRVDVESELGRGSRFIITLPLRDQEKRPGGPSKRENG
jgi:signal transduction histidine kinase